MSELRLHLDEDAEAYALVRALRDRGVDVSTSSEEGLTEINDDEQLVWATRESRVLRSYNTADFCRLHGEFVRADRHHAGIILAEQQRFPVGEMMRRILRLRAGLDAETMRDRLEFLNRW